MTETKDTDQTRIAEAILGGDGEEDLPRGPFTPSREAVADLGRRVTSAFRRAWLGHIDRTIAIAARVRAEYPSDIWPDPPTQATHAELVEMLRVLRPRLMESRTYAHVAEADPDRLAALVDAIRVIDAYARTR